MGTNTIATPEETARRDLDKSRKLREEIDAKRKQMAQEAYDISAMPYRERRRAWKKRYLEVTNAKVKEVKPCP
jgi:hypothetical protein